MTPLVKTLFIQIDSKITKDNLVFTISKDNDYDFSSNIAFVIAGEIKQNPLSVAKKLVNSLVQSKYFSKIDVAAPGFINMKLQDKFLVAELDQIFHTTLSSRKTILVDYSSPNIAKKMHVGHLRSTIIGDSIVKILQHFGHKTISVSHLGDWGTQFGKLIYAFNKWVDKKLYHQDPLNELQRIYVKFHQLATPKMEDQARIITTKLQNKEPQYLQMWKDFCQKSMKEYSQIYQRLNISFDYSLGESFYQKLMPKIVEKLLSDKIAVKDQGAKVIFFPKEKKLHPAIIQKKDGGYLYLTSDLAALEYRVKKWKVDQIIYVTDKRQNSHFKQLFSIAKMCKHVVKLTHVSFGIMTFAKQKIQTRLGQTINLQEILDKGYEKAYQIIKIKNPSLTTKEKKTIAHIISIGAIKYFDLSHARNTDVVFTWDKALSFIGNSSCYIQYNYVRISSLIAKATSKVVFKDIMVSDSWQRKIMLYLYQYQEVLEKAMKEHQPHHIAHYLYKITTLFSSWYGKVNFIQDQKNLNSRLYVAKQIQKVIKQGLAFLGIEVLERM